jgi:hypothetical protein
LRQARRLAVWRRKVCARDRRNGGRLVLSSHADRTDSARFS